MSLPHVPVGPFPVLDVGRETLVRAISDGAGRRLAFALHVGGLNLRGNTRFVQTMRQADFLYADGAAVVALARLGGAHSIQRAPTTDLGHSLLDLLEQRHGIVEVALVGGRPGLAHLAGERLATTHRVRVIGCADGYADEHEAFLKTLRERPPHVLVVGMGMPKEAEWVIANRAHLPDCIVLTCGGWLGFLAGDERRAPTALQRVGLEWVYRLRQHPTRLSRRYSRGLVSCVALAPGQLLRRRTAARTSLSERQPT